VANMGRKAARAGLTCIPKFYMEAETLAVESAMVEHTGQKVLCY
jgi:hypothetical protein